MRKKFEYTTDESRNVIIAENPTLILIEEQNVTEGNFLVFVDSLSDLIPEPTPIEAQIAGLKDDNLILVDIMLTTYEDMLAKGTV
jgi:hypothetical protein